MHARALHFGCSLFSARLRVFREKSCLHILLVSLCAFFPANGEPPVAQDIPAPNEFWFTSETYFVDEDATNAVITVGFRPGDRSWQGWVNSQNISNGCCHVTEPCSGPPAFYRLRKISL